MIKMSSEDSELERILHNEECSLGDRIKIAISIFVADGSSSFKSKQFVLTWFHDKTKIDLSSDDRKLIFDGLKFCILHLKTETLYRPQLVEPILSILQNTDFMSLEKAECIAEVLSNECVFRYFVFHVESYVDMVDTFVMNIQSWGDKLWKTKAYEMIRDISLPSKFNILADDIFKVLFADRFVRILVRIVEDAKHQELASYTDFGVIVKKVLFSDATFRHYFLQNILADDLHSEKTESNVIEKIREYPQIFANDPRRLACCYSIIYAGFLSSNVTDNDKFKILVVFCSFVDVRPIDIDETRSKYLRWSNLPTALALMKLIFDCNLSLDSETNDFTLLDWLGRLIDAVLDSDRTDCTSLELLQTCFKFSPTLIENCLSSFVKNVMLRMKKGADTIRAYSDLCLDVLNVHVKLNRMQKLIAAWLRAMKEHLPALSADELPSKFDILSPELFDCIQTTVTNLPSTVQSVALLNTLLFHFETDCICVLEQDQSIKVDEKHLLMCDIVTYLISRFISGTRIADHSVPQAVKEKFMKLMDDLAIWLGRFGQAILTKEHEDKLVSSFLHLSYAWGEMQLVFFTYETSPKKKPKQSHDTKPTNLVYLHPYLADTHWQAIAQRVLNFGDANCVNLLNDLILQKVHALRCLEDEVQSSNEEDIYGETPAVLCAHFLSRHAHAMWLLDRISEIIHLLKPDDVLTISKRLVEYVLGCIELKEQTELLLTKAKNFSLLSREIRPVVAAMACRVFHIMGKLLTISELHISKELLLEVVSVEMDEEQSNANVQAIEAKLNSVGSLISKNFNNYDEDLRKKHINNEIRLLVNLPVDSLRRESKSILSMMTLLLIKHMARFRVSEEEKIIFTDWCKFLSEVMPGSILPETLNSGKVMAFLYHKIGNVPCWNTIAKNFIELSPNRGTVVDNVLKVVKTSDNSTTNDFNFDSKAERIDVFVSFSLNCRQLRKRRSQTNNEDDEPEKKLKKFSYDHFDEIFQPAVENENEHNTRLALFTVLLRDALESNDKFRLDVLTNKIADFLSVVQSCPYFTSETNSEFIEVLLKYNSTLRNVLRRDSIIDTWFACCYYLNEQTIVNFLKVFNEDEYLSVIEVLFADTEGTINLYDESNEIQVLFRLWRIIIETPVKEAKTKHKTRIVSLLSILALKWCSNCRISKELCSLFADLFKTVIRIKLIPLRYRFVDSCFELVSLLIDNDRDGRYSDICAELLFVFCVVRPSLLSKRIPSFYLCYKSLCTRIAQTSRTNEGCDENTVAISAADKLEKLTDSLMKRKRDFAKTAISAVGDLINVIIECNIEETVKSHLKRIIFLWIGACDSHGLQYLSSTLPPITQNLFKQMCSDYDKYFKFSGKV